MIGRSVAIPLRGHELDRMDVAQGETHDQEVDRSRGDDLERLEAAHSSSIRRSVSMFGCAISPPLPFDRA
jgi:hypothetical protein